MKSFDLGRLKPHTTVILESDHGTLYTLDVLPAKYLVKVFSTDATFCGNPAIRGLFAGSKDDQGDIWPGVVRRGARVVFQFKNCQFVTQPIVTARVEGADWHFEVFE